MEYFWDNVREVLVHQTKIGEVFFWEDDSTLIDDGSNDTIQMQTPHNVRMYHRKSYLSFLLQSTQGTLSQIFLDSPLTA